MSPSAGARPTAGPPVGAARVPVWSGSATAVGSAAAVGPAAAVGRAARALLAAGALASATASGAATAAPLAFGPKQAATVAAFAPKGWAVEAEVEADLDGVGPSDRVLVLLMTETATVSERARALLWLHGRPGGGFVRVGSNVGLLACHGCLGMKGGDAAPEVEVEKRVLRVTQWGGSRQTYGSVHRFRLERDRVRLIGVDRDVLDTLTGEGSSRSENLLTGATEVQVRRGDDDGDRDVKPQVERTRGRPPAPVWLEDAQPTW